MDAAVTPLLHALGNDTDSVLVRVASLHGFGLRDAADGAVVDNGTIEGSIVNGLADAAILAEVADGTGRRVLNATVTDLVADEAGMLCGGSAQLLLTPVKDLPMELGPLLRSAQPLALTAYANGHGGDLVVTTRDAYGSLGTNDTAATIELARAQLQQGSTATVEHVLPEGTVVISTLVPNTRCLIVGSGPMAEAISAQGQLLGWETTISESIEVALDFLATAGPADALAVLSHDASVDVPVLDAALASSVGYIGGMGSRGTQTRRRNALSEQGHDDTDIERIHGPIGLDLGSRTPAETSVAIVAEFLAHRSGRTPGRLTDGAGPING